MEYPRRLAAGRLFNPMCGRIAAANREHIASNPATPPIQLWCTSDKLGFFKDLILTG